MCGWNFNSFFFSTLCCLQTFLMLIRDFHEMSWRWWLCLCFECFHYRLGFELKAFLLYEPLFSVNCESANGASGKSHFSLFVYFKTFLSWHSKMLLTQISASFSFLRRCFRWLIIRRKTIVNERRKSALETGSRSECSEMANAHHRRSIHGLGDWRRFNRT